MPSLQMSVSWIWCLIFIRSVCLSVFFFLVVRFGELRASFVDVCFLLRFMPFWMKFFLRARLRRRVKKLCLEGWSI